MAARIIGGIAPKRLVAGKERIGPRVPGPDKGAPHVQHRRAIDGRDRVVVRLAPIPQHRPQVLHLDHLVALPVGIGGLEGFRGFGIQKEVGLIGALVHRRTAQFGEPDRFRLRHPRCGLLAALPADPVVMRVQPPVADILVAPDPWLVMGVIGDRGADLGGFRLGRVVEPVIALAAFDIGAQIGGVVDRVPRRVGMITPLAPIRQRHVVVDPDEVDIAIGPKRIKVKEPVSAAVDWLIAEVFGPVRRIADFDMGPEDRPDLSRQRAQGAHGGKAVVRPPQLRQAAHFRPDAEAVHPACCRA